MADTHEAQELEGSSRKPYIWAAEVAEQSHRVHIIQ